MKPENMRRALLALFLGDGSAKVASMMGMHQSELEEQLLGLVPVTRASHAVYAPHAPAWPPAVSGEPSITVHVDAGSRGNPGPSACAFIARRVNGEQTVKGRFIGVSTNNEAEYHGLIQALRWLAVEKISGARILMDSLLVVNQVLGRWKVKEPRLRPFVDEARELVEKTASRLEAVPREENMTADAEVNRILDREDGASLRKSGTEMSRNEGE